MCYTFFTGWNWIKNEDTGETELYFEGPISDSTWLGDEITPSLFRNELEKVSGNLTVWINSPGGDCISASQIYTMLRNHKSKVTVKIDGIAASAASVAAMAGDETLISPTGYLMIHNPMTYASGNKAEMEKAIALLDEIKEGIINAYTRKTGLSRNKISKLMDDETWLNAEKAQQLGFADGILFTDKDKKKSYLSEKEETEPDEKQMSMLYSPSKTTASLMQKISALVPKGVPINQLDKRLALLK
ncbi:MAG: head maturation protease, ClpP-related [Oscillospiraceae bacterium]